MSQPIHICGIDVMHPLDGLALMDAQTATLCPFRPHCLPAVCKPFVLGPIINAMSRTISAGCPFDITNFMLVCDVP